MPGPVHFYSCDSLFFFESAKLDEGVKYIERLIMNGGKLNEDHEAPIRAVWQGRYLRLKLDRKDIEWSHNFDHDSLRGLFLSKRIEIIKFNYITGNASATTRNFGQQNEVLECQWGKSSPSHPRWCQFILCYSLMLHIFFGYYWSLLLRRKWYWSLVSICSRVTCNPGYHTIWSSKKMGQHRIMPESYWYVSGWMRHLRRSE